MAMVETAPKAHLKGYIVGYVLSLGLTAVAFALVNEHITSHHSALPHSLLIPLLTGLALTQFVVQMVFFLHLGGRNQPKWRTVVFWFMVMIVLILVAGSLWIMHNLNYNMLSPEAMKVYMRNNEGL